jgi:type VI secretion system secreted protein VgrG
VHRLLESEGIGYVVEADPDKADQERFVFLDQSSSSPAIDAPDVLPVRDASQLEDAGEAIYGFEEGWRVRSGAVVLRDYDFQRPAIDLTATAKASAFTDLEIYDYPGGYVEPDEGKRLARTRLEELGADGYERTIVTDAVHVRAGRKLTIEATDGSASEWFVVATSHRFESGSERERDQQLRVEARLIPIDVAFRPAGDRRATDRDRDGTRGLGTRGDPHRRARPLPRALSLGSRAAHARTLVVLDARRAAADLGLDGAAARGLGGAGGVPGG